MQATQQKISNFPTKEKELSPNVIIGIAAFISFLFSVFLWFFVDKDSGLFVGIWVPSILSLGTFIQSIGGQK